MESSQTTETLHPSSLQDLDAISLDQIPTVPPQTVFHVVPRPTIGVFGSCDTVCSLHYLAGIQKQIRSIVRSMTQLESAIQIITLVGINSLLSLGLGKTMEKTKQQWQ